MTHRDIRNTFNKFFRDRHHVSVPSSSLVPNNDPTVLLTTAGMQQFKPYFLDERDAAADFHSRRLSSIQRCFRTSDIDEVGDATHNTFFEMLGNFSIGDYFKADAIALAWDFLTRQVSIDPNRLWATIFAGDDQTPRDGESERLWQAYLPTDRICTGGREANFWGPAGKTGPCGPSSELHIDLTNTPCDRGPDCRPNCPCGRFMELWNLVFTEFKKDREGHFHPLNQKNIDTGMGLERLALILQGKKTIFETDLFGPIVAAVSRVDPMLTHDATQRQQRQRIIADHLRAAVFLISDGVEFSNKDQGYVLRRIVRRALDQLDQPIASLEPILQAVRNIYGQVDERLPDRLPSIAAALDAEQKLYQRLLAIEVEGVLKKMRQHSSHPDLQSAGNRSLSPDEAFTLYSTHGLSLGRLEREGFTFDRQALEKLVTEHQQKSRSGSVKKFGGHGLGHGVDTSQTAPEDVWKVTRLHTATHLLHAALRAVLGPEVQQNGSDINPERLRFDFNFSRRLTDAEKRQVEDLVNQTIKGDLAVSWAMMPFQQALDQGALAFFKEKYGGEVKVYTIGDFSKELCGGPHVDHTNQVGRLKILSEKSSSAGVRRIKAVVLESSLDTNSQTR